MRKLTIIILLSVFLGGFASFFEKSKSQQAKSYVHQTKDKLFEQVPNTKVGEMYHQSAAKTNELMGNNLNAKKHETLVKSKRIHDDLFNVLDNGKLKAEEGCDCAKSSGFFAKFKSWTGLAQDKAEQGHKFGLKTIIMFSLLCSVLFYIFGPNQEHVKFVAQRAKRTLHEVKGETQESPEQLKEKVHDMTEIAKEKGKEMVEMGKEMCENMKQTAKEKGQEMTTKVMF
jgi:ABC-type transporter MlaC component